MFAERLKELRKSKKHLTQQDMANILGVAKTTYASYEQGKRTPDADLQNKIADYFGVTLDYLHGRNQTPEWATDDEIIELDKLLESNVNMAYGGETLTPDQIQRVKDILSGTFWDLVKKDKEKKK
ncbi:helix-turn-helix domain-containing protein [Enterococcus thailandicus]|uniref:helix-turn-helix domain-containing protein n=1 Tax=Enterococcus thailandicus TaxID=417368 RepID=UPI0025435D6E|nr:helix-turn-helix transcriptional regulator [Enterococcus thailandicus]MDK4351214.1 helix-turn-helix domain-containing protein [Enterococcus thailandicus]MDT2753157.1 helix-turn-helix transcriptional regulator [Enterococcus thailandicus]